MGTLLNYLFEAVLLVPLVYFFRKKLNSNLVLIAAVNAIYYFMVGRDHLLYLAIYLGITYLTYQLIVHNFKYKTKIFFLYVISTLSIFVLIKLNQFKILGYSFILFQNYAFLFSLSKKDIENDLSFLDFFAISAFFPVITAGPISSIGDIKKQLESPLKDISSQDLGWGSLRMLNAFFKKSVIDFIMTLHFVGFIGNSAGKMNFPISLLNAALVLLYYYFDFSASSDLAIGAARTIGVQIGENFKSPYMSYSVAEFWRRWHISLGSWFQSYFLVPIQLHFFRNYKFIQRFAGVFNYLMVFVTFLAIGLWHGVGARFFVWGCFNGFFVVLTHMLDRQIKKSWILRSISWALMIVVAFVGQYILLTNGSLNFDVHLNSHSEALLAIGYLALLAMVHSYDAFLLNADVIKCQRFLWFISVLQFLAVIMFFNPNTTFMYSDF